MGGNRHLCYWEEGESGKRKLPDWIIFHCDEKGLVTGELVVDGLREFCVVGCVCVDSDISKGHLIESENSNS